MVVVAVTRRVAEMPRYDKFSFSREGMPDDAEMARINAGIDRTMAEMVRHCPYSPGPISEVAAPDRNRLINALIDECFPAGVARQMKGRIAALSDDKRKAVLMAGTPEELRRLVEEAEGCLPEAERGVSWQWPRF
jgi:hypothetical protein